MVLELIAEDERQTGVLDRGLAHAADSVLDNAAPIMRTVGPYRIVRTLGQGGMGVVFLGERADLGRQVAIKVLRDAFLSPSRRERFSAEQRTLARLEHPFIARLYDADILPDGTPYFVMECVEGERLNDYCRTHDLPLRARLDLFLSVCEAVQFAHRHAIIHRDLKPSNILVSADGTPKLLDFGIAKQLDDLNTPGEVTQTGFRLMTPAYAAPEQVLGEPVGTYTDVYALGVILYEILAGHPPFDLSHLTPGQAEHVIVDEDPAKPSAARSNPPLAVAATAAEWRDLDVLCLTAMHKDAQRRYRTVEGLRRDVSRFLAHQPLEARPDAALDHLRKFLRRNWRPVSIAATVVIAVVTLVAFYTVRLATARDAALAEAARTQRIQQFLTDLFSGGDDAAGPADTLRVVTLVDRGTREAAVLDGEPAVQAELYHTLGNVYRQLGNFARADSLLTLALERRKAVLGPDAPQVAEGLVSLGTLRLQQAELDEAERLIREGLDHTKRTLPAGHPLTLDAMTALGSVLQERGSYDEAVVLLDSVARLQGLGTAATPELSNTLTELANTHFYAGNMETSDSLNRMLLTMDSLLYGDRHPHVAEALINLGAIQVQLGEYAEAERYYRQALTIKTDFYGPEHFQTGANLTMLGRSLVYQGETRLDEAEATLQRALVINERVYGPVHPRVASTLNDIGNVAMARDDYDAAEAAFSRMADTYVHIYAGRHYLIGIALSNLANVYMERGDLVRADSLFRDVIWRFTDTLSPEHLNTGVARIKLGHALVLLDRHSDAEPELLAGYQIVSAQSNPGVSWLQSARRDLVRVYEALGRAEEAERFRKEAEQYQPAAG